MIIFGSMMITVYLSGILGTFLRVSLSHIIIRTTACGFLLSN